MRVHARPQPLNPFLRSRTSWNTKRKISRTSVHSNEWTTSPGNFVNPFLVLRWVIWVCQLFEVLCHHPHTPPPFFYNPGSAHKMTVCCVSCVDTHFSTQLTHTHTHTLHRVDSKGSLRHWQYAKNKGLQGVAWISDNFHRIVGKVLRK